MESRKRKREASEPRVKYHIQQLGRSFERILKENSREELCEVVRKKLELDSKTNLELVQIREGVVYDLEDDDDFEAFKAAAYAYSSLDVRVSFPTAALPQNASNTRAGASPIPDFSAKSSGPQGGPQEKVAQKHVSIADYDNQNRSLAPGAAPGAGQQGVELERSNSMLSSPRETIASPPKKKRKHVHIELDTMASESQKERDKNKRNESIADPTVVTVVPGDNEQQGPPRKKRKRDKYKGQEASSAPVDEAQTTATDAPDTTNKPKKSKPRKGNKEKGPEASNSLANEERTVTAEVTDTTVTEVRKRKSRKGDKEKGSETFGSLVSEAQTATASVADAAVAEVKKSKSGEGEKAKGPQASISVVHEAQAAAADRSDAANATNAKSKKSRPRKGDKEKGPGASESSMDGAQTTTAEPSHGTDTKSKTSKSQTLPPNAQDTHDVIMHGSHATGSKEQPIDIEAGSTIQKSSTKTLMSVKATSESAPPVVTRAEPPARSSESHNSPANPSASTSDPVRLTYASFFNRPRRTASELLAMYSDAISKTASLSDPPEADHRMENVVASKNAMTAAEDDKKKKNTGVDVSKDIRAEKPKPKLGKSHLSESWVPVDAEEPPSLLAGEEPSTSDPSKALDAAPLPKPPEPVPRTDPTPKNPKTKNLLSTSKQASPCPICLSRPFHLRFKCPVIISGVDAMLDRIAQLQVEGGKEDLISELEEWVQKARRKSKGKGLVRQEPEPNHGESSPQTIGRSEHRSSPLPSWAPIVSHQSHPSEVIVESTHEGSESASSASSEQDDAQSEASSSTDGSSSGPGSRSISPSPNLEQVDLNALIRGPSLTMNLSKLDDDIEKLESESHTEGDSAEGDIELLEEEEHPLPKHLRRVAPLRSRSPEEIDGDEEEDLVSSVEENTAIVGSNHQSSHEEETESSVSDTTGGDEVQQDPRTITDTVRAQVSIHPNPEPHVIRKERHATPAPISVHQPSPTPPAPTPASLRNGDIIPVATSTDLVKEKDNDAPPVTLVKSPSCPDTTSEGLPQAGSPSTPSRSRATTPVPSNTSPFKAIPHTPGTIQRMKDKNGRLPLNPPDDEIGVIQPVPQSTRNIVGVVPPKEKDYSGEPQPEPSRVASHSISAAKPSTSRSNTTPSPVRLPSADNTSSISQPAVKRRGRPPLSEAVKAERKAMRDAQKAAKADKRPKTEVKKIDPRRPKAQGESTLSQEHVEQVSSPPPVVVTAATPVPMSRWTSLPPVATSASTNSLSSPAIDQLMSSSELPRKTALNHVGASLGSSPTPIRLNGVRSPGSVSLASGSRRHDEEDVEKIVGSSESAAKRTPLFMPGASQMSQSQAMPRFVALSSEDTMRDGPDELGHSPSVSSSDGEGRSTKEATISPRGHRRPKSAFPSLSQLSFDKFKPSFLLTSVFSGSQGQGQREKRDVGAHPMSGEDDSEEEEEESSGTEQESSHVPKDKRAGVNVPVGRKSRSRGLLH